MDSLRDLAAICGLYCGTCPSWLAPRENDIQRVRKISEVMHIPIDEVPCDGCLSNRVTRHCQECRIRKCAIEKQVTWCFECDEFPCRQLRDFTGSHIVDGISHHANVIEDLRYMRERGIEQWLEQQDKAGRCPQCAKRLYWFSRKCPVCDQHIR